MVRYAKPMSERKMLMNELPESKNQIEVVHASIQTSIFQCKLV